MPGETWSHERHGGSLSLRRLASNEHDAEDDVEAARTRVGEPVARPVNGAKRVGLSNLIESAGELADACELAVKVARERGNTKPRWGKVFKFLFFG